MSVKVKLEPYQRQIGTPDSILGYVQEWLFRLSRRVGDGPILIQGYAVAGLPDAAEWGTTSSTDPFSSLIYVYDETGGATLAFSDGTNWRRVQDRAIVS
jgi:hypothetical protein